MKSIANKTLNIQGRLIDLSKPTVMGVLNVTPDSFHDGGRFVNEVDILRHVEKLLVEGATFIDIGGYSSRPGAEDISTPEELKRTIPAIQSVIKKFPKAIISVDTFRSEVARAAVQEGASMVNDISGGELDPKMFQTMASLQVPYILMHIRGNPQTMAKQTVYEDLLKDVANYFHQKIFTLHQLGIKDIIIDPGFGFAKTREQNFELLNHLDYLKLFNKPLLAGLSRKSMIWKTLTIQPEEALNGTTSLHTIALLKGVSILRVHDVKEAMECVKLFNAMQTV